MSDTAKSVGASLAWTALVGIVFVLPFAALIGDLPSRVHADEPRWSRAAQWTSAVLFYGVLVPIIGLQLTDLAVGNAHLDFGGGIIAGLPFNLALLLAIFVVSRRFAAARAVSVTTKQFINLLRTAAGRSTAARLALYGGLAAMTVGLYALPLRWGWLQTLVLGGFYVVAAVGIHACRRFAGAVTTEVTTQKAVTSQWAASAAFALGITPAQMETTGAIKMDELGRVIIAPVPPAAYGRLDEPTIDARLGRVEPDFMVLAASRQAVVFGPATEEVVAGRVIAEGSGGLVVAIRDLDDSGARPKAVEWSLASSVGPSAGPQIDALARAKGQTVVEFKPFEHKAIVATLPSEILEVRERIARTLNAPTWEIQLDGPLTFGALSEETNVELLGVTIRDVPRLTGDSEARARRWTDLGQTVIGHEGWSVEVDERESRVTMRAGLRKRLPARASLVELLPDHLSPDDWSTIPNGVGVDGEVIGASLADSPHALVVGETGSGKSVLLVGHAVQALSRGHELAIIDPTKNAVDFTVLQPWVSAAAITDVPGAQALFEHVYRERVRRQKLLQAHGVGHWTELPESVRVEQNVRPITVVIDEAASLLEKDKVNLTSLDSQHPLRVEAAADGVAKDLIRLYLAKLGREARNVGIFLILGLQRPDTDFLPGEFRANLGQRTQLKVPGSTPPAAETLRMMFAGPFGADAANLLSTLDDGHKGFGVTMGDGGVGVVGVRVAFAEAAELPAILEARGVPHAVKWDVAPPSTAEPVFVSRRRPAIDEPESETLGEWAPSLADLEDLEPAPQLPAHLGGGAE